MGSLKEGGVDRGTAKAPRAPKAENVWVIDSKTNKKHEGKQFLSLSARFASQENLTSLHRRLSLHFCFRPARTFPVPMP